MTRRHPPIPAKVPVEWTQADDDSLRIEPGWRETWGLVGIAGAGIVCLVTIIISIVNVLTLI